MSLLAAIVLSFMMVSQALKPSFISSNVMSFEQAEMFCKQNGGHLAQPSSARDEYFEDNESDDVCYWFGAYALPSGGYYWTNGTAIPWHNWNSGYDEIDCTMAECAMVMKAIDHKWLHITGPDEKYQALCEPSAIVDQPVDRLSQLELQMNQWRVRSLVRFGTTESTIKT
ncbi:hypothetical protein HDE_14119 [Halotydeus destructor]|nr:hypothetical protein HDE_14119 [Halotydeus destructor]